MAMLDANALGLEDSVEPTAVPDGTEAQIRIIDVSDGTDKNGLKYLMPRMEIPTEPYSKDFTYFMHIPNPEGMDAKRLNQTRNTMKVFLQCFDIDMNRPFDIQDDLKGREGWAILGLRDDPQYGEQNYIKKLLPTRS